MTKSMRAGEDITEPTDSPTAPTAVSHAQHTPGPWRVTINGGFHDGMPNASVWIEADTYTSIASLIPHKGVEGNARLIAAAPDLLAALRRMLDCHQAAIDASQSSASRFVEKQCDCGACDEARAVIAKVEAT